MNKLYVSIKKTKNIGFLFTGGAGDMRRHTHTHTLMILTIVGGVEAADVTDAADPLVHLFF